MKSLIGLVLISTSNAVLYRGPEISDIATVKPLLDGFKIRVNWDHSPRTEKYEICYNCDITKTGELKQGTPIPAEQTCGGESNRCHVVGEKTPIKKGKASFSVRAYRPHAGQMQWTSWGAVQQFDVQKPGKVHSDFKIKMPAKQDKTEL